MVGSGLIVLQILPYCQNLTGRKSYKNTYSGEAECCSELKECFAEDTTTQTMTEVRFNEGIAMIISINNTKSLLTVNEVKFVGKIYY